MPHERWSDRSYRAQRGHNGAAKPEAGANPRPRLGRCALRMVDDRCQGASRRPRPARPRLELRSVDRRPPRSHAVYCTQRELPGSGVGRGICGIAALHFTLGWLFLWLALVSPNGDARCAHDLLQPAVVPPGCRAALRNGLGTARRSTPRQADHLGARRRGLSGHGAGAMRRCDGKDGCSYARESRRTANGGRGLR
jgi:hypothetical protein